MKTTNGFLLEILLQLAKAEAHYRNIYKMWVKSIKVRRAIRMANLKSKAFGGKRVYVLEDAFGNYHACLSKDVEMLKRRGLMNKKATIVDLLKESIYHTL